ncbi:TetR/AcrR family transcriptional regulator [Thermostaphylospora chromogena]|uniref:DNA-binding transcriptional regulator, AcrR family n=1 Tax=Thermostaphylospora chromogena TaxID=35622 RepID=A0A1H1G134_9ACTN|nr:TetR/AcrR family transcriptional regulator [Thermostaphylospora chromogena]SDR06890.1 DNA-binding transcriptional regulator, AcrR family [Thermostaphylospora chromogena]
MDHVPRKPPPGRGHRERLLAGAVTCLQERGYADTTVRDLVAVSGTNMASIGYHFGGKEALLHEALAECFRTWTSRVEEAVLAEGEHTVRGALERALAELIDVFEEQRPLIVSCVEAFPPALRSEALRAKLRDCYAEARRAGVEMVRKLAADGGTSLPAEALVSVIIAISDGLMLQWLLDPDAVPDARQVIEVLGYLGGVLAAEEEPRTGSAAPADVSRPGDR